MWRKTIQYEESEAGYSKAARRTRILPRHLDKFIPINETKICILIVNKVII